jgi:hypothetical protein
MHFKYLFPLTRLLCAISMGQIMCHLGAHHAPQLKVFHVSMQQDNCPKAGHYHAKERKLKVSCYWLCLIYSTEHVVSCSGQCLFDCLWRRIIDSLLFNGNLWHMLFLIFGIHMYLLISWKFDLGHSCSALGALYCSAFFLIVL